MRHCLTSVLCVALAFVSVARGEEIIIPAAAHTAGVGSTQWRTDLAVKSRGGTAAEFTVELLQRGIDNSDPLAVSFFLAPDQSARFEDLVDESFAFEGTGALRITPTVGDIIVSSRTYNDNPGGTFGQFIPGYPRSQAIGPGETATLIQLSRSEPAEQGYRTNIGFVNVTPGQGTVEVSLYTGDGVLLGTLDFQLPPYGYDQATDIFATVDAGDIGNGYAILGSKTAGMDFFAYASVVDNRSGDAIFIPAYGEEPEVPERFSVFEVFVGPVDDGIGQALDQLTLAFANRPAIFLEHNGADRDLGYRVNRWWARFGEPGDSQCFPFAMVDSGFLVSYRGIDYFSIYEALMEMALLRQPTARIQVDRHQVEDEFFFDIELTNLSPVTLDSSTNRATIVVMVFEESVENGFSGRTVRAVSLTPIVDLEPGQTTSFLIQVAPPDPDWENLHSVVLAEYRPNGSRGHFEALQAAYQH